MSIMTTKTSLHIWTDGACPKNGFGATTAGVGVYFGEGDKRNVSMRLPVPPYTNQRAELWALLVACQVAEAELATNRALHVVIHTDSMYGINCLTMWLPVWILAGWTRAGKKKLPVMNRDILEPLYAHFCACGTHLELVHVRGHSGDPNNDAADALAVAGCTQ